MAAVENRLPLVPESGSFYASTANKLTGPVIDQTTIMPDLRDPSIQTTPTKQFIASSADRAQRLRDLARMAVYCGSRLINAWPVAGSKGTDSWSCTIRQRSSMRRQHKVARTHMFT